MVSQTVKVFGAPDGAPGIQVRETSVPNLNAAQGFGSTAVFAALRRGPMGVPVPVDSRVQYEEMFGKPGDSTWHLFKDSSNLAPDAIDGIFSGSGGTRVWIVRNEVDGKGKKSELIVRSRVTKEPVLKLIASNEGRWGGYDRTLPSTTVVLLTARTFTVVAPGVSINEFLGATVNFDKGSGKDYTITANTASDERSGEVVFTVSSQFDLIGDGITGPQALAGLTTYSAVKKLTGTVEIAKSIPLSGTVTLDSSVIVGDGTLFATELTVGETVYFNDIPRLVTSISSDTTATVDAAYPIPVPAGSTLSRGNLAVIGDGTIFGTGAGTPADPFVTDLVGKELTFTVGANTYKRTVKSVTDATNLEFTSNVPEDVPAGAELFTPNLDVSAVSGTSWATELSVGDYIIDPNRSGSARRVSAIDAVAESTFTVDAPFEGGDFTNAALVKQTSFATIDLKSPVNSGLAVEIGQGIKYPQTHFSLDLYFEGTLVFSAGDVSLDPEDDLYVEREINEGNIGYRAGTESYQTWLTAEVLRTGSYTTASSNDIRPANGSSIVLAVTKSRIYTAEILDPDKVDGSLLFPNPYKVARQSLRVKKYTAAADIEGTISYVLNDAITGNPTSTTITGNATNFTKHFTGDTGGDQNKQYIYIAATGETKQVIAVNSDIELVVDSPLAADIVSSTAVKAGYYSFDGVDVEKVSTVGDRYLNIFRETFKGGYDGDTNTIPFQYTRYFDLDTNLLEDAVYGKNQGLIRVIVPGNSDVTIQKAAAAYCSARAFEFRAEIPSSVTTEALAESFLSQQLGRNDAMTISFPSYGYISSPFARGKRLIPITGDLLGMESRRAINVQGYHVPAAGVSAVLGRVTSLPATVSRRNLAILNNAGIQQIFELSGNVIVFGARSPAENDIYGLMHIRRTQSSYVRYFMEARSMMQVLFRPNQPETVEQILLFLRSFAEREYKKGVYTNFLTFEDTVSVGSSATSQQIQSKKDVILSIVNGELLLQYSYLPTGIVEKVKLDIGPSEITSAYTTGS